MLNHNVKTAIIIVIMSVVISLILYFYNKENAEEPLEHSHPGDMAIWRAQAEATPATGAYDIIPVDARGQLTRSVFEDVRDSFRESNLMLIGNNSTDIHFLNGGVLMKGLEDHVEKPLNDRVTANAGSIGVERGRINTSNANIGTNNGNIGRLLFQFHADHGYWPPAVPGGDSGGTSVVGSLLGTAPPDATGGRPLVPGGSGGGGSGGGGSGGGGSGGGTGGTPDSSRLGGAPPGATGGIYVPGAGPGVAPPDATGGISTGGTSDVQTNEGGSGGAPPDATGGIYVPVVGGEFTVDIGGAPLDATGGISTGGTGDDDDYDDYDDYGGGIF